jgi:hypothetical protein
MGKEKLTRWKTSPLPRKTRFSPLAFGKPGLHLMNPSNKSTPHHPHLDFCKKRPIEKKIYGLTSADVSSPRRFFLCPSFHLNLVA